MLPPTPAHTNVIISLKASWSIMVLPRQSCVFFDILLSRLVAGVERNAFELKPVGDEFIEEDTDIILHCYCGVLNSLNQIY